MNYSEIKHIINLIRKAIRESGIDEIRERYAIYENSDIT